MAVTNHNLLGKALELPNSGLLIVPDIHVPPCRPIPSSTRNAECPAPRLSLNFSLSPSDNSPCAPNGRSVRDATLRLPVGKNQCRNLGIIVGQAYVIEVLRAW